MPIYKLADEMPYEELLGWFDYFARRPIGWRDDDRTYKLLQAQGVKEKAINLFPSLNVIFNPGSSNSTPDEFNTSKFKTSLMFNKMLSAKGGDALQL